MILQSCAIKSQLQDHSGALTIAKEGLLSCIKVLNYSFTLCKSEISHKKSSGLNSKQVSVSSKNKQNIQKSVTPSALDEYSSTTEYGAVANNRQNVRTQSQVKMPLCNKARPAQPRKPTMNTRNSSQLSNKSSSQITPIKTQFKSASSERSKKRVLPSRQSSCNSSLKFHLSEGEDDQTSLERIHTFNLKTEQKKDSSFNQENSANKQSSMKSLKSMLTAKGFSTNRSHEKQDFCLQSLSTRENLTSAKNRSKFIDIEDKKSQGQTKVHQCYVEEQAQMRDSFMMDAHKILESIVKRLSHYLVHLSLTCNEIVTEQDLKKEQLTGLRDKLLGGLPKNKQLKMTREFSSLEDIEQLRKSERYKFIGRNLLGVRKFDDWINNLEIGNVMHLNPITTQELIQNIGKHHEFQKDPMLKKLVLLSVSFFSIATEMRMMVQFNKRDHQSKDELQANSEMWHAQAVFYGSYYLPFNCPLITHVTNSYNKHYIIAKNKRKELELKQHQHEQLKKDQFQKNTVLSNFLQKQTNNDMNCDEHSRTISGQKPQTQGDPLKLQIFTSQQLDVPSKQLSRNQMHLMAQKSKLPQSPSRQKSAQKFRYEKLAQYIKPADRSKTKLNMTTNINLVRSTEKNKSYLKVSPQKQSTINASFNQTAGMAALHPQSTKNESMGKFQAWPQTKKSSSKVQMSQINERTTTDGGSRAAKPGVPKQNTLKDNSLTRSKREPVSSIAQANDKIKPRSKDMKQALMKRMTQKLQANPANNSRNPQAPAHRNLTNDNFHQMLHLSRLQAVSAQNSVQLVSSKEASGQNQFSTIQNHQPHAQPQLPKHSPMRMKLKLTHQGFKESSNNRK